MVGSEIVGVVAAAAKVAGEGSESGAKNADVLNRVAESSGSLQRAADLRANRLAVVEAVKLKLLMPLARVFKVNTEYFDHRFAEDLSAKLEGVPEADLRTPPASIAVPAMQSLAYSIDEVDLKEMYLNLLARAMDGRCGTVVHPSFVDTVRQLSAEEAAALLNVLDSALPIVRVNRHADGGGDGYEEIVSPVLQVRNPATSDLFEVSQLAVWVENWRRLGLVEIDYSRMITGDSNYAWVDTSPDVVSARAQWGEAVFVDKGILRPTAYGKRFRIAVGAEQIT